MSSPEATQASDAALIAAHLAATNPAAAPSLSLRHINDPCSKHGEKPPGEQSWNDDGSKKRDPNGFDHACDDCQANATVQLEG